MKRKQVLKMLAVLMTVILCSCGSEKDSVLVKDVMIENEGGTCTKAQIVIPSDYKEKKLPLVTLSHGFHGTMNSAGGEKLAHALAENGIATIRMNFSRNQSSDPDSGQTNRYTVETMVADQVLCAAYMVKHYNTDPNRIGLFGRSLGGRAVMTAANEHAGGFDYRAMVLVAPAGDSSAFQRYMGGQQKWDEYQKKAAEKGSITYQNVVLTPEFFQQIEDYVPSEHGDRFSRPVLVIYNTEDHVVLPETAVECAKGYADHRLIRVTTEKSPHGLEMGFEESEIRAYLFDEIISFYKENLR